MRMNGGVPRLYDYFFRMIGRMVRELSRGIARSPEMKNIQRDLRNMAKDVQREFSSYQGREDFSSNDEDGGWRPDNGQPHPDGDYTDAQSRPQYSAQNQYGTNRQGNSHVSVAPKNKYKTVSTAGILFTVFGGIGLGVFLIFLLMTTGLTLLTDMFGMPYLFLSIVLLILTGISIWMLAKGISLLKRTSRLKKYLKIVGSSQFCPIDMLVRESGFDRAFVLKDLQKMIQKRVLPDAHIDDQKTCLMLGRRDLPAVPVCAESGSAPPAGGAAPARRATAPAGTAAPAGGAGLRGQSRACRYHPAGPRDDPEHPRIQRPHRGRGSFCQDGPPGTDCREDFRTGAGAPGKAAGYPQIDELLSADHLKAVGCLRGI